MSEFKKIDRIADYVLQGLTQQRLFVFLCAKTSAVTAKVGTVGQYVRTVMQNGMEETVNCIATDRETGHPDWIVTNPTGECYVVRDSVFRDKYIPDGETIGRFLSKGKPVAGVRIDENISFEAPWGEEMRIAAGGVLILNGAQDIYGIQAEEFASTYRVLPPQTDTLQKALALLQQT